MKRGKIRLKKGKKLERKSSGAIKADFFLQFLSWKLLLLEKLRCCFDASSVSLETLYLTQ